MDTIESKTESEKARHPKRMSRLKVGCLALLLVGIGAIYVAQEVLAYQFSVASVTTFPLGLEGVKIHVFCSGFGDVSCDCFVSSGAASEDLYPMTSWFTDSLHLGTFFISADGKFVVTESDFTQYLYNPLKSDPGDSHRHALYTHAFDVETLEYIRPKGRIGREDEAAHRDRHEVIASMLEAHGGIGSKVTLWREEFETRPMSYWEWRRWQSMINAAFSRRLNE